MMMRNGRDGAGKSEKASIHPRCSTATTLLFGWNERRQLPVGTAVNQEIFATPIVAFQSRIEKPDLLTNNIKLIATDRHTLILTKNNTLWAYGNNEFGSIPVQDAAQEQDQFFPMNVNKGFLHTTHDTSDIVDMTAGNKFTLFRMRDGALYCSGVNKAGQCGDTTDLHRTTPHRIDNVSGSLLNNFNVSRMVSCVGHTLVLDTEGRLVLSWGYGEYGQLGREHDDLSNAFSPARVNTTFITNANPGRRIVDLACGVAQSFLITSDGLAWGWGLNSKGQLGNLEQEQKNPTLSKMYWDGDLKGKKAQKIVSGFEHTLVLSSDGKLYSVGNGEGGELGLGASITQLNEPKQIGGAIQHTVITQIACGDYHNLILSSEGNLYVFGQGTQGALATGSFTDVFDPMLVTPLFLTANNDTIQQVFASAYTSLLLTSHGDILTSGSNSDGDLGDMHSLHRRSGFSNGPTVSMGALIMPRSLNRLFSLSIGAEGQCFSVKTEGISKTLSSQYHTMVGGFAHALLLNRDGKCFGYGSNQYGQLGDGTRNSVATPKEVSTDSALKGKRLIQVAAAGFFSLFLSSDGQVFCTGQAHMGQCGDSETSQIHINPVAVYTGGALKDKVISQVACDESYSLALSADGQVFSWGTSSTGALGVQGVSETRLPVAVDASGVLKGKRIKSISAGGTHSLILSTEGKVYSFGAANQLGTGQSSNSFVPVMVDLSVVGPDVEIQVISSGYEHSLMLTQDGMVLAMGSGQHGCLGNGQSGDGIWALKPIIVHLSNALWLHSGQANCATHKRAISVTAHSYHSSIQLYQENEPICFGEHYLSPSACSGHGTCLDDNKCECDMEYGGDRCSLFACGWILPQNTSVCNGRGRCIGPGICECDEGFGQSLCQEPICFGKLGNDTDLCSGKGDCLAPDACSCPFRYYLRSNCSFDSMILLYAFIVIMISAVATCCIAAIIFCVLLCIFERKKRRKAEVKVSLTESLLLGFSRDQEMDEMDADSQRAKFIIKKSMLEIDFSELEGLEKVGSGGSGALIFKGKWRGNSVAVKVFKSGLMSGETFFEDFEHEVSMMSTLRHKNLVNFYGCSLSYPRIAIIMEYCALGSVASQIEQGDFDYKTVRDILHMLIDVCEGVLYLHSFNVIHRDLKCDNLLCDESGRVKIGDFGISKFATDSMAQHTMAIGTSIYMAPELMQQNSHTSPGYDTSVDVFSFSIVAFEMLTRKLRPYPSDMSDFQIQNRVATDASFRPDLSLLHVNSPELRILLTECWSHDPRKRPSFEHILERIRKILEEV